MLCYYSIGYLIHTMNTVLIYMIPFYLNKKYIIMCYNDCKLIYLYILPLFYNVCMIV